MLRHRPHLDRVAEVGLVGAVFPHRLGIGNAREHRRYRLALAELLEQPAQDRLDRLEHVLLLDEAHLDIELVELAGRAIGAGVLVTKARRDLEIAVEARNHHKLLELLRRLRQRVELARVQARRHEKIARALGRRRGQDRRLEFHEAGFGHAPADRRDDLRPLDDVVVQLVAPEIDEPIGQPRLFGILRLAEDRQRQFRRLAEDFEVLDEDLDLAGRKVGIDRVLGARLDRAFDPQHPFRPHGLGDAEGRRIRIGDALRQPVMVAQVDEEHAAMVAHPMNPTRHPNRFARGIGPKRAAGVRPVAMHVRQLPEIASASLGSVSRRRATGQAHARQMLSSAGRRTWGRSPSSAGLAKRLRPRTCRAR